jgi:hypothetical protein
MDSGCLGFNDNYARLVAFGSNLWGAVLSFVSYDREIERFRYHLQSFLDDIMPSIHKAASIVSPTSQHNVYADHKILENLGLINAAPESITSRFRL